MINSNLIVLKKQTDAISTNRGFYYQYLTTLKLWIGNYLTKENIEIYCETEDDIFQINKLSNNIIFTQVKCYSDGFGIKSNEILKSLLNFFMLHLKYENKYNGQYLFETNAGTKPTAGKFLKDWKNNQEDENYVINSCANEVRKNLLSYIDKEINNRTKKIKDKKIITYFTKIKTDFNIQLNSKSFDDFLLKVRWQFLEKDSKIAINELISEINEFINLLPSKSASSNLIFGRLLSEIIARSSEEDIPNRILDNNLLDNILNETIDIVKNSIRKEVAVLMETNFQILNDLDIIKNATVNSLEILKLHFTDELPFDEFLKKYSENAIEKLTRVDFFALNTPQGIMKSQKIRLHDIYVKPNFMLKKKILAHQNIQDEIFDKSDETLINFSHLFQNKQHIIILGGPGAGKSILAKSIVCSILNKDIKNFKNEDIFYFLPFRIELRKYLASKKENRDNISKYLKRILEDEYYISKVSVKQIESILDNYPTLFIFDGLDEIFDTANKNEIVEDIEVFTNNFKKIRSVVTSRIVGYDEAKLSNKFLEIYFQPFNESQIEEYLNKWYNQHLPGCENDKLRLEEIKLFLSQKDQIDKELLTNPLLLSLIVILFSNNLKIPNSKLAIYENCTNTLVDKWDSSKQLKIEISPELLKFKETIFADLAFWQYLQTSIRIETKQKNELTHNDALDTVQKTITEKLKLVDDYLTSRKWAEIFLTYAQKRSLYFDNEFTHKTFREYYTAFWIFINLERKHKIKERDDLISKYISNPFWHIVLELLINMIDEKQPDNEIIDELIKNQISSNEWSYVFILDILPKIKHISKSLISEVVTNAIVLAVSKLDRKKNRVNSLSERISEQISERIEFLISDTFYYDLVEKSIVDIYNIIKDDEAKIENYFAFFKELDVVSRRKPEKSIAYKLPIENTSFVETKPYLYFLANFKDKHISFDNFFRFVELFGSDSLFKDFPMYFHSRARWSELSVRFLFWQFENIENIENNIILLKNSGVAIEKFYKYTLSLFHFKLPYENIINFLPKVKNSEVKSLILLMITNNNNEVELFNDKNKKFSLELFNSITTCNSDKEILEYLIFSKDIFENKLKRIEKETGIVINLDKEKIHSI